MYPHRAACGYQYSKHMLPANVNAAFAGRLPAAGPTAGLTNCLSPVYTFL